MKALIFYRYLRGYVSVNVSGGFIERFINLCNRNKIILWDIIFDDGTTTVNMYCKDFFAIRPICRKSGVRLHISAKKGLIFDFKSNRNKRHYLPGIIIAAVFMLCMNMFVWEIETTGSDKLSEEEILSIVKEAGLHYGTFTPFFNSNEAARNAVNFFDGKVLWLAINIKGSKAIIEVRDLEDAPKNNIKTLPSNLIANFDGTLIQAQTHSGVQIANVGESVTKGEMLISGIYENEDGSIMYQPSKGVFTAYNEKRTENKYNRKMIFGKFTDYRKEKNISIFHLKLSVPFKHPDDGIIVRSYNRSLTFKEKILPFGITDKVTIKNQSQREINLSNIYFLDRFTSEEYENMKNSLIIKSDYNVHSDDSAVSISCVYKCIDYIGEEVTIIRENLN